MSYESLLSKIPGGAENTSKKFPSSLSRRKREKKKCKWNIFLTFVFKQERQDVGVTLIHLSSSVHPQVLTCKFCSTECEIKIRSLMNCWWTAHGAKCFRPHLGQTGECQVNVDMWWNNGCCVENDTKCWNMITSLSPQKPKSIIFFTCKAKNQNWGVTLLDRKDGKEKMV